MMMGSVAGWIGVELADGRYQITKKLGEGGMGFVLAADDRHLQTQVVIKIPRPALLDDADAAKRFLHEIRSLVRLSHPHVVKILDVGEHDGLPFAVMQFLSGGSLRDRCPAGRAVSVESLERWLPAIAEALDFVHQQKCVHRDIKPANILFDKHGHAYLSDFGVVKGLTQEGLRGETGAMTGTGLVLGTPDYMAPEVILGKRFDGRADQYALAVMIYELLAGRLPFVGRTPSAVLVLHSTMLPPPLSELAPSVPQHVVAAIVRGLSKDPAQRFPSCTELADGLLAKVPIEPQRSSLPVAVALDEEPKNAPPSALPAAATTHSWETPTARSQTAPARSGVADFWSRIPSRLRPLVLAAVAVTAISVVAGLWVVLGSGPARPVTARKTATKAVPGRPPAPSPSLRPSPVTVTLPEKGPDVIPSPPPPPPADSAPLVPSAPTVAADSPPASPALSPGQAAKPDAELGMSAYRPQRQPVPGKELLATVLQNLEERFPLANDAGNREKADLARRIFAQSSQADGVDRFALLRHSLDLAADAGDSQLTMLVIDQMAELYEIDAGRVKAAYGERLAKSLVTAGQSRPETPPSSSVPKPDSAPKPADPTIAGLDEAYRLLKLKDAKGTKQKLDDLAKESGSSKEQKDYRIELCRGLAAAPTNLQQAERYFDWCVKARGDEPAARNNLALVCLNQRKFSKAIQQFERVLEEPNPPPEVLHNLNRLQQYVTNRWIVMDSAAATRLSKITGSAGADRAYQPGHGWQYLSLRHEDGRLIGDLSAGDLEDRRCCFCLGFGRTDCRSCNNGSIRQYVNKVIGTNPTTGQDIIERRAVYVTCDDCRGQGTVQCASCRGKGLAIDLLRSDRSKTESQ